jgi:hypothetical protein
MSCLVTEPPRNVVHKSNELCVVYSEQILPLCASTNVQKYPHKWFSTFAPYVNHICSQRSATTVGTSWYSKSHLAVCDLAGHLGICVFHVALIDKHSNLQICTGATVQVGVDPSKVVVTKLKLDKDRRNLLERKQGREAGKARLTATEKDTMENID